MDRFMYIFKLAGFMLSLCRKFLNQWDYFNLFDWNNCIIICDYLIFYKKFSQIFMLEDKIWE